MSDLVLDKHAESFWLYVSGCLIRAMADVSNLVHLIMTVLCPFREFWQSHRRSRHAVGSPIESMGGTGGEH